MPVKYVYFVCVWRNILQIISILVTFSYRNYNSKFPFKLHLSDFGSGSHLPWMVLILRFH